MVGRGTRITPNKDSFYLVDFQDNLNDHQEQLVSPWILNEEPLSSEPTQRNQDRAKIEEFPRWAQEELELAEVDLDQIVGYVEYEYDSGRRDGFLIHSEDEEQFLSLWEEFAGVLTPIVETDVARRVIDAYEAIRPHRLSLTHVVTAFVALTKKSAWYTSLVERKLPERVLAFIGGAKVSEEKLANLERSQASIYALIKFIEDEIDRAYVVQPIYENEQVPFAEAQQDLKSVRHLRGFALRGALEKIYTDHLMDTHLTSFEWERFAIQWLTQESANEGTYILYWPQDKNSNKAGANELNQVHVSGDYGELSALGILLSNRRTELGYTQWEVAKKVGVKGNYLGYLERGLRYPSDDLIPKLAKALKLDELKVCFAAYPRIEELIKQASILPQETNFGRLIETRRRELGWTQTRVARKVGVRGNYLGYLERGKRYPSDKVVDKLAQALNIDELTLLLAAHPRIRQLLVSAISH